MVPFGVSAKKFNATHEKWVVMTRPSLMRDYVRSGVEPNADDAWSWSMWRGYLSKKDGALVGSGSAGGSRANRVQQAAMRRPLSCKPSPTR